MGLYLTGAYDGDVAHHEGRFGVRFETGVMRDV